MIETVIAGSVLLCGGWIIVAWAVWRATRGRG